MAVPDLWVGVVGDRVHGWFGCNGFKLFNEAH